MSRERPPRFGLINDGNKREEYLSVLATWRGGAMAIAGRAQNREVKESGQQGQRQKGRKSSRGPFPRIHATTRRVLRCRIAQFLGGVVDDEGVLLVESVALNHF